MTAPALIVSRSFITALRRVQHDKRIAVFREDLLDYIDRHGRGAEHAPADTKDARRLSAWRGGASITTRKLFKFFLRLFKVNEVGEFIHLGQSMIDPDGYVRIYRNEMHRKLELGNSALTKALSRLEALGIVQRKHEYNKDTGFRQAWFRLNPDGIYRALVAIPAFRLHRRDLKVIQVRVTKNQKRPPQPDVVESGENSNNPEATTSFSLPEPVPQSGQKMGYTGPAQMAGLSAAGSLAGCAADSVAALSPTSGSPGARITEDLVCGAGSSAVQPSEYPRVIADPSGEEEIAPAGPGAGCIFQNQDPAAAPASRPEPQASQPGEPPEADGQATSQSSPDRVPWDPSLTIVEQLHRTHLSAGPGDYVDFYVSQEEGETLKVLTGPGSAFPPGDGEDITEAQMEKFCSWCRHPVDDIRLTLERAKSYVAWRDGSITHDWWLNCKFEFFLKAWPRIVRMMLAQQAATAAEQDLDFQAACLAYAHPDKLLAHFIQRAANLLGESRFVRITPDMSTWKLGRDQICDGEARVAFYLANLRNPEIAPFMESQDLQAAQRGGFEVSESLLKDAAEVRAIHLLVRLVESARRKEVWPELNTPEVLAEARRYTNEQYWLNAFLRHFGVFECYVQTFLAPLPVFRTFAEGRRLNHERLRAEYLRRRAFELPFAARLANLANRLVDYTDELLGLDKLIAPLTDHA